MKKTLQYYMSLNYPFTLEQYGSDGFIIQFPDLVGCITYGYTIEQTLRKGECEKRYWFESALKNDMFIPEPTTVLNYEYTI